MAVLEELRRLSHDGLHAPVPQIYTALHSKDVPGTHWIKRVFGSYERAVLEAELVMIPQHPGPRRRFDKETIVPQIVKEVMRLSPDGIHMPPWERYRKLRSPNMPTPEWIAKNVEGGFGRLQKESGLLPAAKNPAAHTGNATTELSKPLSDNEKSAHKRRLDAEEKAKQRGGLPVSRTYTRERKRKDGTTVLETWHVLK